MTAIRIIKFILNLLLAGLGVFLSLLPVFLGALISVVLTELGLPYNTGTMILIMGLVLAIYGFITLIMSIISFVACAKHRKAYFVMELIIGILGLCACIFAFVFPMCFLHGYWRYLTFVPGMSTIRHGSLIGALANALSIALTVIYALFPEKKVVPVPMVNQNQLGSGPEQTYISDREQVR
ncbi:MAG: hypothetical protein J6Y08_06750 [Clostridiales bacterium]|nr:hypothetical protein [Clostridiales bacterium]